MSREAPHLTMDVFVMWQIHKLKTPWMRGRWTTKIQVPTCLALVNTGCIHLCRMAGNTAISYSFGWRCT